MPSTPVHCHIGDRRFRLELELGRGGTAEVYRARETVSGGAVAIKVLREKWLDSSEMRTFFVAEARWLQRLDHPRLPSLLGVGQCEDGRPCLVMPLYEGASLETLVETSGPQPMARLCRDALGICDVLGYLHGENLRHGDLKPANVLYRDGEVVLADLGLTQAFTDERRTVVYGTAHYLAPEVIRGQSSSAPADVYALGGLLFYAATGTTVFEGRTSVELCARHLYDHAPSPSARMPSLPRAFDDLVGRCLAKEPAERPDLAEVREALCALRELRTTGPRRFARSSSVPSDALTTQVMPAEALLGRF